MPGLVFLRRIRLFARNGRGISPVAYYDWPLDSLEMNAVAAVVCRVRQQDGKVLVKGKAAAHACSR